MKTILLVEDYDDIRTMLKIVLEQEGYRVLEATSGPEATAMAKRYLPDLILTDLGLPGFDGVEAIKRVRTNRDLATVPVIVLSAFVGSGYYEAAVQAGADYFLSKPVDLEKLTKLVHQLDNRGDQSQRPLSRREVKNDRSMVGRPTMPLNVR